jgi:hypothetical protein
MGCDGLDLLDWQYSLNRWIRQNQLALMTEKKASKPL